MGRSETVILTNMCMICDGENRILVQNRKDEKWPGISFPGGHVEKNESFVQSVIREVYEETGLTIENPTLCGVKQFQTQKDERYVVMLFKTHSFQGQLRDSEEGENFWITKDALSSYKVAPDFLELFKVFESAEINEFYYSNNQGGYEISLY